MNINPKVEPWLRRLLDGVENSNHSAEVVAQRAYEAVMRADAAAMRADERAASDVAEREGALREYLAAKGERA